MTSEDSTLRVVLVDDHEIVRRGLKVLLDAQDDIEEVGEAGTVNRAIWHVTHDDRDVVVLDVRLPDGTGIGACRKIPSRRPDTRVLMLTSYADGEALSASVIAGAWGYGLRRIKADELFEPVRRMGSGEPLLDPVMTEHIFRRMGGEEEEDPLLAKLSSQERNILNLLAGGLTSQEIAEESFLAEKTVKNSVSNLLTKVDMSRRGEAAAYAARIEAEREHRSPPESWD
ncbi:MAG: response regulator [Acidimicrobiia bacterium]